MSEKKFQCNKHGICGLADKCFHGKPHTPIRCGGCRTWCADSLFCQPGTECSVGRHGDKVEGQLVSWKELIPMRCVEVEV